MKLQKAIDTAAEVAARVAFDAIERRIPMARRGVATLVVVHDSHAPVSLRRDFYRRKTRPHEKFRYAKHLFLSE